MIEIKCPKCEKSGRLPGDSLGKAVRCKRCDHRFTIAIPERTVPGEERLMAVLRFDADWTARMQAAKALGGSTTPEAFSCLVHALKVDAAHRVREAVAESLARIGNTEAVEPLGEVLRHWYEGLERVGVCGGGNTSKEAHETVWCSAARALAVLGDRRAIPALLERLGSAEKWRRDSFNSWGSAYVEVAILRALGELGGDAAVATLRRKWAQTRAETQKVIEQADTAAAADWALRKVGVEPEALLPAVGIRKVIARSDRIAVWILEAPVVVGKGDIPPLKVQSISSFVAPDSAVYDEGSGGIVATYQWRFFRGCRWQVSAEVSGTTPFIAPGEGIIEGDTKAGL